MEGFTETSSLKKSANFGTSDFVLLDVASFICFSYVGDNLLNGGFYRNR